MKEQDIIRIKQDIDNAVQRYSESIENYNNAIASRLLDENQTRELTSKRDMYIMLRNEMLRLAIEQLLNQLEYELKTLQDFRMIRLMRQQIEELRAIQSL